MGSERKELRFKEYNPEEIKKQLPDGFSPLESLPVSVDFSRNTTIKVHGFANAKEANDFMNNLAPQFISACKLTKGMKSAIEYEYQLIAPYQLAPLFSAYGYVCEICVKSTLYGVQAIPNVIYRQLGEEKYVQDLFDKGSFQISTFKRCRVLESDLRRDKYELRNIVEIYDGSLKMEADVQFNDNLLLLCTSTSSEDLAQNKSGMIKITNVFWFISEITKTLTKLGYLSAEIVQGPCKYSDKVLQINGEGFLSSYMSGLDASGEFDGASLISFIRDKAENDVLFTKPYSFVKEQEYRIVWKLIAPFYDDNLIITNPNLGRYCEPLICTPATAPC